MLASEYVTRIMYNFAGRTDKATNALVWLNLALQEMHAFHDWRDMHKLRYFYTTANTYRYALPSDFKHMLSMKVVYSSSWIPLVEVRKDDEVDKLWAQLETSNTGVPRHYGIFSNWFWMSPTPDAAYQVYARMTLSHTDVTTTSTILFNDNFQGAIIAGATYYGFLELQLPEDAKAWRNVFDKHLLLKRREETSNPDLDLMPRSERIGEGPHDFSADPQLDPFVRSVGTY